jgi:hypothetical protein
MYDFLIGGKTGASPSLAVDLFDHNSSCRRPLCVVSAVSSSNRINHSNLQSKRKDFAWLPQ